MYTVDWTHDQVLTGVRNVGHVHWVVSVNWGRPLDEWCERKLNEMKTIGVMEA